MKCPFCAEDIKDEAVVCRYCGRDFTLVLPLKREVGVLTARLAALEARTTAIVNDLVPLQGAGAVEPRNPPTWLVVLAAIALLLVYKWLGDHIILAAVTNPASESGRIVGVAVTVLGPALVGIWLGIVLRGARWGTYLIAGLFAELPFAFEYALNQNWTGGTYTALELAQPLLLHPVASALGALTGGMIGDWIERARYPHRRQSGTPERLAERVLGTDPAHPTPQEKDNIAKLAGLVSAVAPILTLIGTVLAASLGK